MPYVVHGLASSGRAQNVPDATSFKLKFIQRLICPHPLQPRVLLLERLQPFRLVEPQAAGLLPPPGVRLLADPELLADLRRAEPAA